MPGMDRSVTAVVVFAAVFGSVSLLGLLALRRAPARRPPAGERVGDLAGWGLAGRRLGTGWTWFLMGGAIYTAYTFVAVPALVYGVGALGFFAVPYTVVVYPLALLVLPRLWTVAARNGYVTGADLVRGRFGSPGLALAVACTGILATMPYVALQLLGIQAVLTALGVPPQGPAGDLVLTAAFTVLAVGTYRWGLRAPAAIAVLKAVLVFGVTFVLVALVPRRLGGFGGIFAAAEPALAARTGGAGSLVLSDQLTSAYTTLAVGSALALLVYPHVVTATLAARSAGTIARNCVLLPAWTAVLGLLALLGVAAVAAGVAAPPGRAELALPLLVAGTFPPWFTGVVFGALAIGALVPAAIMSVAAANLFTRNVYVEYLHPQATPGHQTQVARLVSVLVKVGALVFVLGLRTADAINLQLLGGVWILQTFPAVVLGLWTRRLHRVGLLAGWATGMVAGTALLAVNGFVSVLPVALFGVHLQVYVALLALAGNLAVAVAVTGLCRRLGLAEGLDTSGIDQLAGPNRDRGGPPDREWLAVRP